MFKPISLMTTLCLMLLAPLAVHAAQPLDIRVDEAGGVHYETDVVQPLPEGPVPFQSPSPQISSRLARPLPGGTVTEGARPLASSGPKLLVPIEALNGSPLATHAGGGSGGPALLPEQWISLPLTIAVDGTTLEEVDALVNVVYGDGVAILSVWTCDTFQLGRKLRSWNFTSDNSVQLVSTESVRPRRRLDTGNYCLVISVPEGTVAYIYRESVPEAHETLLVNYAYVDPDTGALTPTFQKLGVRVIVDQPAL